MSRERRPLAAALALMASVIAPARSAPAAPPTDAETSDDAALFRLGLERYDAHDYAAAIAAWERLVAASGEARSFKVLYNLGLAYEAAGDATHAVERYDAFIKRVAEQPGAIERDLEERRQDAVERTRSLKASYAGLRFVVAAAGQPLVVRVDGGPARRAPFTAYVTPGHHTIDLGEGARRHVDVDVSAGSTTDLDATAPPPPPIRLQPTKNEPAFPTAVVAVGAGVTLVSFTLPVALYVRARSKRDDADALGRGNTQYASAIDEYESARTAYYVSYAVPAVVGAVTLGIVVANLGRLRSGHASIALGASGKSAIVATGAF